jgi:hypothetical protein
MSPCRPRPSPASTTPPSTPQPRGVDLAKRYGEIVKIIAKHFSASCANAGIEVDDLVQEVAFKIHRANIADGASKYDPSKAQFSKYVFMMTSGQLKEMLGARRRHPLTDLDCPDLADDRGDAETRLSNCVDAIAEVLEGLGAPDDDEKQIGIAGTGGPAWRNVGDAVAAIQARQPSPRTRTHRPAKQSEQGSFDGLLRPHQRP